MSKIIRILGKDVVPFPIVNTVYQNYFVNRSLTKCPETHLQTLLTAGSHIRVHFSAEFTVK